MARNISVKVPTSALIAEVEKKIAEIDKAIASYPADYEKYEKQLDKYRKEVVKFIADYVGKNLNKIGDDYSSDIRISHNYQGRVELIVDKDKIEGFPEKPEEPRKPNQQEWFGREHTTRKGILEKNLRILRMTNQEEVNATTYGAILELL
jgi:hypothetical protein